MFKNKSAKVKQEVARLQQQAAAKGKSRDVLEKEKEKALREKAKAEEEKRMKEEAALLKPVLTQQKVPFGVDPKTVLCVYYKAGHCEKGNKCKFSHDLNVGRKVEKKNLYEDSREEKLAGTYLVVLFGLFTQIVPSRYHGHLGRRKTPESCPVKSRQPQNYHRCW
ncbi:hypothetical protein C0991_010671 [Blastosporella zonata]|nr:hypothetical protein C0991_010671 [Blastosporella zonata]